MNIINKRTRQAGYVTRMVKMEECKIQSANLTLKEQFGQMFWEDNIRMGLWSCVGFSRTLAGIRFRCSTRLNATASVTLLYLGSGNKTYYWQEYSYNRFPTLCMLLYALPVLCRLRQSARSASHWSRLSADGSYQHRCAQNGYVTRGCKGVWWKGRMTCIQGYGGGVDAWNFFLLPFENAWSFASTFPYSSQHGTYKGKVKIHPRTCYGGPEGELRCSSTLSLTSAQDDGWPAPRPGHITPGNAPVTITQEAGWGPGSVWTGAENLASHRDSIPGTSSSQRVAIPTELSRPIRSMVA